MKVCFLHPQYFPAFSGHAIQLDRIRERLRNRGIDVEVWTPRLPGTPVREYRNGFLVRRFGPSGTSRARRWTRNSHLMVHTFLGRWRYDILHHAGIDSETRWAILPALLARRKQVVQMTLMHGDDPLTLMSRRPAWLSRRLFKRVDHWIALGTALKDAYLQAALPPERLDVIPVGVDLSRFAPAEGSSPIRLKLGLPVDVPIVVAVGDVIPRKGYDLLVEAAAEVKKAVPDVRFVVVGPTSHVEPAKNKLRKDFMAKLEARMATLGVRECFRFVGPTKEVERYLQAANVFAFPSRAEGLPNSVMEASAAGLPVVMTDLPGVAGDLVDEGHTGYIVPQEDSGALAERLVRLLKDPTRARAFGLAGRQWVLERFDQTRVVEQYLALYDKLLQSPPK